MKVAFSFIIITCYILSSCCKTYCDESSLVISFQKLKAVDTDTIYILGYQPGSSFTQRTDSIALIGQISPIDTTRSSVSHSLVYKKDWKVIVPALGKQYLFSDFVVHTEKCSCGSQKYVVIDSYKFNNSPALGHFVLLE